MSSEGEGDPEPSEVAALSRTVEEIGHLLPGQGPIASFIHHNTLHAFEDRPFEEAVVEAGDLYGCEPFLSEDAYRREVASGRIRPRDVQALLAAELGDRSGAVVAGTLTRLDFRLALALNGIPEARGPALSWLVSETRVLKEFRKDLPIESRSEIGEALGAAESIGNQEERLTALWRACLESAARLGLPVPHPRSPVRHRDLIQAACGVDTDQWVHPLFIRFLSAYLDQGLAQWAAPCRDRGLYECFVTLYSTRLAVLASSWARGLPPLLAEDRARGFGALQSLAHSLVELGVPAAEHHQYLLETALSLRGWAGMVWQVERRPDRLPGRHVSATLVAFLAVHLVLERAASLHAARDRLGYSGSMRSLRSDLAERSSPPVESRLARDAWMLFHVAQLCGMDASVVGRLSAQELIRVASEVADFGPTERRRVLHLAYERLLRHHLYDAVSENSAADGSSPAFQAIFCIDDREESFRRHLEEICPDAETFGVAGFFGVAMYYRGATDAQPRPLCPAVIRPAHYVSEQQEGEEKLRAVFRRRSRPLVGHNIYLGSHTVLRGAVLMPLAGAAALVPLVFRVLFPWFGSRIKRIGRALSGDPPSRLDLDRKDTVPPVGEHSGFTVREMAGIVRGVLESIGIAGRLAPLVLVVGHGSTSLNNPHESAHDCGACGGGRGGPNARAFAQMANDPRVRRLLEDDGLGIPAWAWFLAAEHNTCDGAVEFFDVNDLPTASRAVLDRAKEAIGVACQREAHERCRRFDDVPPWYPPFAALVHVESRAANLAQPRPEYGHATNAFCIVGRRSRTRGLFLDRRAFLASYDPTRDPDGRVLSRVLASTLPVVAGISLEYYFGRTDPAAYGCGTKLPHNVTSLLGVMDGAGSDLRTGLPWQMVEIHEPVRLSVVVETTPDLLGRIVRGDPDLERLVRNRWIFMAALDPNGGRLWEWTSDGWAEYRARSPIPTVQGASSDWYGGKRGHLRIARIETAAGAPVA